MIETPFAFITLLLFIASSLVYLADRSSSKLFEYLPAIVILYFSIMLLSLLGVWERNDAITATYKAFKGNLVPAMIFLMLLQTDIRKVLKLGKKILLTFFLASVSIAIGFILTFALFHHAFKPDAWKAFGALSGSWMGGTGNMVAIQEALNLPELGNVLIIDTVNYSIWVIILLSLVPFAPKFNRWVKADNAPLQNLIKVLQPTKESQSITFASLFWILSLSLMVSLLSQKIAMQLPTSAFITEGTWKVLLATIAGILAGVSPLSRFKPSAMPLGNMMLYFIVALIASRANFEQLTQAPLYLLAGFTILTIHALTMILFAKLFRIDLFSLGVASLANIGGVASAPILAEAYNKALVQIGVLMAMMGYIIGTFTGLGVAKILMIIAS